MHAQALLLQGEMSLLKKDDAGFHLFDKAAELAPEDKEMFYAQALALYAYGSEEGKEKALLIASKKLKIATLLDPDYFAAWHLWGNVLSKLGRAFEEHHYFLDAQQKYQKAIALKETRGGEILAELYWDFGALTTEIAKVSEEPLDYHLAVQAFQNALTYPYFFDAAFWNDYGTAQLNLAEQVNENSLFIKAIHCFKQAVSLSSGEAVSWMNLAAALDLLYERTHDEDHFSQANDSYRVAAQMRPYDTDLWLDWAQFLLASSRLTQDTKRLRACIEKCHRAYACNSELPHVIAVWAEALALLGELSERHDLILEAQNKIAKAIDLDDSSPDIWYSQGMCLSSFAKYFNDTEYHYQAIEKFQYSLSIDRTYDRHWHAIANAYAELALLNSDPACYELAAKFYTKAIDLRPCSIYVFDYAVALARWGETNQKQRLLEDAVIQFEKALSLQKNAIYIHPDWLFHYACTLDSLGDFYEEASYYIKAIELLSHVLMIDPDYKEIHYHIGLAFFHLGELNGEKEYFYRAAHHFRLATKQEEENDQILLDWAITLINIAEHLQDTHERIEMYRDAEHKLTQSARMGNLPAYYHLACLYSLLEQYERAFAFIKKADAYESLPPIEEIYEDEWLDGLRSTGEFQEFLAHLEKRQKLRP